MRSQLHKLAAWMQPAAAVSGVAADPAVAAAAVSVAADAGAAVAEWDAAAELARCPVCLPPLEGSHHDCSAAAAAAAAERAGWPEDEAWQA